MGWRAGYLRRRVERLLDQVRATIRARHYSRRTEDAYVHWIRRFIVFHGRRHPRGLLAADITTFITWFAVDRHVAGSTQNQALSGILFLYKEVLRLDIGSVAVPPRARVPSRVPVVLTPSEARTVIDALSNVPRIVVMLLFGAGLRLQESLELRVKDLHACLEPWRARREESSIGDRHVYARGCRNDPRRRARILAHTRMRPSALRADGSQ